MGNTYNLSTDIGKVRLKISDKDIINPHFTDEEITAFLAESGNVINLAAAAALESWAASVSDTADSEKIGDYSYTKKQAQNMLELSKRLRDNDSNTPACDWAEMNLVDVGEADDEL